MRIVNRHKINNQHLCFYLTQLARIAVDIATEMTRDPQRLLKAAEGRRLAKFLDGAFRHQNKLKPGPGTCRHRLERWEAKR